MSSPVLQACFLVAACFFALLAVELPDMLHAVLALLAMSASLGGLFWLMGAPYVAVFQLLVYGGAVVALFTVTVTLTSTRASQRVERKLDAVWGMGALVSLAIVVFAYTLIRLRPFEVFRYAQFPITFAVASPANVIRQVSQFLWTYRGLDAIAQAFVLFAAALGSIALLRPGRRGGSGR